MNAQTELTELVRGLARQDWETVDALLEELRKTEWAGAIQIIGAAFVLAVHRRFRPGQDLRDITHFVAETRSRYQEGSDLPALAMEGLIRAALGEVDLMDEIRHEDSLPAQIVILGTLLQDEHLTDSEVDQFIADVKETATEHL